MKRYLLIAGKFYYPGKATSDWIGVYETYEEAEAQVKRSPGSFNYKVKGHEWGDNWYEIVDLKDWTK